jgi:hypothetical protein
MSKLFFPFIFHIFHEFSSFLDFAIFLQSFDFFYRFYWIYTYYKYWHILNTRAISVTCVRYVFVFFKFLHVKIYTSKYVNIYWHDTFVSKMFIRNVHICQYTKNDIINQLSGRLHDLAPTYRSIFCTRKQISCHSWNYDSCVISRWKWASSNNKSSLNLVWTIKINLTAVVLCHTFRTLYWQWIQILLYAIIYWKGILFLS